MCACARLHIKIQPPTENFYRINGHVLHTLRSHLHSRKALGVTRSAEGTLGLAARLLEEEVVEVTFSRRNGPGTVADVAHIGFLAVAGFAFVPVVDVDVVGAAADAVEAEVASLVHHSVLGLQAEPWRIRRDGRQVGCRESKTDGGHHRNHGEETHDCWSMLDSQW